jgi:tetraacyldisaccharide 4'-kinase
MDIVLVSGEDVHGATTFPSGRLREPPDLLIAADAIVAVDDLNVPELEVPVFSATRTTGEAVFEPPGTAASRKVLALAGIAAPMPFFQAVQMGGWTVVSTKVFADHHAYTPQDLDAVAAAARTAGADAIMTTEKDFVRLLPFRPFPLPVGWVPLTMEAEPRADFRQLLVSSLASARDIVLV